MIKTFLTLENGNIPYDLYSSTFGCDRSAYYELQWKRG